MPARPPRAKKRHASLNGTTEGEHRERLKRIATFADEYAGIPMTFKGQECVIHPSYRFAKIFNDKSMKQGTGPKIINRWRHVQGYDVNICHRSTGKAYVEKSVPPSGARMMFAVLEVSKAWTMQCEERALEKLSEMIKPHLFDAYRLTGSFLETSKRSGLTYIFRRLRPTVVLTPHRSDEMEVLCCLCLHPMGYYKNSWGGVMVPTDEVIAHLCLMRGDEAEYWKQANQIAAWRTESGL